MKEKILNVFFPRTCPVCGEVVKGQDKFVCDRCKGKVFYMKEPNVQNVEKVLKKTAHCAKTAESISMHMKKACVFFNMQVE